MKRGDAVRVRDAPSIIGVVMDFSWTGQWWSRGWVFPHIWRVARVRHTGESSHHSGECVEWAVKFLEKSDE